MHEQLTADQRFLIWEMKKATWMHMLSFEKRSAAALTRKGLIEPNGTGEYRITAKGLAWRREENRRNMEPKP